MVAGQDAFLVLSEIYYPLRWKAEIDGREQKVLRVNGILRGVQVPAGEHDVVFSFDRKSFENGRKLSLAGFMVGLLLTVSGFSGYGRWRRMR